MINPKKIVLYVLNITFERLQMYGESQLNFINYTPWRKIPERHFNKIKKTGIWNLLDEYLVDLPVHILAAVGIFFYFSQPLTEDRSTVSYEI